MNIYRNEISVPFFTPIVVTECNSFAYKIGKTAESYLNWKNHAVTWIVDRWQQVKDTVPSHFERFIKVILTVATLGTLFLGALIIKAWYRRSSYNHICLQVAYRYQKIINQWEARANEYDAEAFYSLGCCYAYGRGVKAAADKNINLAITYFKLGAKQSHARSMLELAHIYDSGIGGIKIDKQISLDWFQKSAEAGDADAMIYLGNRLVLNIGVEPDVAAACKWYKKAAQMDQLEGLYLYIATSAVYSFLDKTDPLIEESFRKLCIQANNGNRKAMRYLAYLFKKGLGVKKNKEEGAKWLKKSRS